MKFTSKKDILTLHLRLELMYGQEDIFVSDTKKAFFFSEILKGISSGKEESCKFKRTWEISGS